MSFKNVLQAVQPGMTLIVHASFRPCKEEGLTPEDVIHALQEKLTPEGTLLVPTFSYCYINHPRKAVYDKDLTPGVQNGVISETLRTMPDVIRSSNPTYSVAVWGKHKELLTSGSADNAGLGYNSSYENALKLGAKILLLNVGNNRNSMLHYAEIASEVPYNDIPFRESWGRTAATKDGEMILVEAFPACSENFSKFDDLFVREGIASDLKGSYLMDAQKMVARTCELIREQPDIMLCDAQDCECCVRRRARLKEKGLI